jgi:Leucine-rich repeat (LRR) protein
MKINKDFLKKETCNFDLECVFSLDLSRKDISEINDLKECSNLEILNLFNNQLVDLKFLSSNNQSLLYLNVSYNKIVSLDGLENLKNLKTLNLAGNQIEDINEFSKLKNLSNLFQINVNDPKRSLTNPFCIQCPNYVMEIKKLLPNLECLDGEF